MSLARSGIRSQRIGKLLAAVVVGLSVGTLLPPEPVSLPLVGTVPGALAGGVGLLAGGGLYLWIRRTSSGCSCSGECSCS